MIIFNSLSSNDISITGDINCLQQYHKKEVFLDQVIDWLGKSLTSREHASGYMKRPCNGHEMGCLWLLPLKPNTGGVENHRHNVPFQTRPSDFYEKVWYLLTETYLSTFGVENAGLSRGGLSGEVSLHAVNTIQIGNSVSLHLTCYLRWLVYWNHSITVSQRQLVMQETATDPLEKHRQTPGIEEISSWLIFTVIHMA